MAAITQAILDPSSITYGEKIGEGGFAVVYKVKYVSSDGIVDAAAKRVDKEAESEIKFLSTLQHKNVVKYFGYLTDARSTTLVTEFAEKGDLRTKLRATSNPLPNDLVWRWVEEGALGISFLHENGVVHRDVKSANFLIIQDDTLKLADFGLAKELDETMSTVSKGTVRWMAPEVINDLKRSKMSDVYSYGIVIWEICARQLPFASLPSDHAVMTAVCKGERPDIPDDCPQTLRVIISKCWQQTYRQRPSMRGIVEAVDKYKVQSSDVNTNSLEEFLRQSAVDADREDFKAKHSLPQSLGKDLDVEMRTSIDKRLESYRQQANQLEDMDDDLEEMKRKWNIKE